MRPAIVEYAKGWGYEVTFPGRHDPIEVSEADVESEFARRYDGSRGPPQDPDDVRRRIAEEIAETRLRPRPKGRR